MSDRLPHAVWSGTFRLFGIDVGCHVLDDGRRIIDADSMTALLDAMADPSSTIDLPGMEEFARWKNGR